MSTPPSGLVTFLFTDVEGSTRRWEADADEMRTALAAHDAVLRSAIEAHDGFLFKHTGDGCCAAFASPRAAVDAAITAQLGLELPVRMGLATGEAEIREGDYFGAVLNRAARVMAAGHGGQILLADSTAALLSGIDLIDLGSRRLRDLPIPVGLFQVRGPGLRTDFPPLRALDASSGNLRLTSTSFIGRESEVAEIEATLRAHRLTTMTGAGGVGKTRLATEVAARIADEFADGVWFFDLAAVADPAAVPDAVAAVLTTTQQPGKSVSESVAAALEGRLRLLVFDNCEHVLDAAADLIDVILAHSDTVRIMATSREGLGVVDEQLWPVPSLTESAAVALFVERAQSVSPRFCAANGEAAVTEICDRLDRIPLAIELAASRMASMTAAEVLDRLDQRFRLLVGSRRGLHRHHTLRQAVAWSYDLLDDAEKALLNRCSVFAGGFDLESACAVSGSDDEYATLDLLDALVRKSLLVADRSSGRTRFSMLETIREFAEEQLVATGEATRIRDGHARHYAGRETDVMTLWDSPRQPEAYEWFSTELANLRTAFRWATDQGDLDTAATIATYVGLLGMFVENYEPAAWAEEILGAARSVGHPRLAYLYGMAAQCFFVGRLEEGVRYVEAGREAISGGCANVPYGSFPHLGGAYLSIGRSDRWLEMGRAELARGPDSYGFTRASLVMALSLSGHGDEAIAAAEGLVETAESTQNPAALSYALLAEGYACRDAEPRRALEALRRGLQVAQRSGNRANESILAMTLGNVELNHGDPTAALECIALAIRNYHDSGNIGVIGVPLANLAILLDRLEHYPSAASVAGFAIGSAMATLTIPEFGTTISHLRDALGDQGFESLAREGASMTTAAMATFAYDEIERACQRLRP